MAKVKGPVFSTIATKSIAGTVTYQKKHRVTSAHLKTYPGAVVPTVKTWRQRDQGNIIALLIIRWQTMTDAERNYWNTLARTQRLNMSGYHLWLQTAQKDLLAHYGLAGYWSMNGVIGGITPDISRNGNDGTLGPNWPVNAPAHIPGDQPGEAWLSFDGVDDYVDCGNDASLNIADAITVEAWVKPTGAHKNGFGGIWHDQHTAGDNRFLLHDDGSLLSQFNIGGTVTPVSTATGVVPLGHWTRVVHSYDGSNERIFANGEQKAISPKTGAIAVSTNPRWIGRGHPTTYNFNGLIDEVRIYNRALTAEEIRRHYLREKEWRQ